LIYVYPFVFYMELDDDYFGLFGVTGITGVFFVMMGLVLIVYASVGISEGRTALGQIQRFLNPDAAAAYADLAVLMIMGIFLTAFGLFLAVADYIGED